MKTDQATAAAVIEQVDDGLIVIDHDFRCVHLNRQAEWLTETTSDELQGRNVWDALPGLAGGLLPAACHKAVEEQRPQHFDERNPQAKAWWEYTVTPAPDSIIIRFCDAEVRKLREEDLRLTEESCARFINSLGGITWLIDPSSNRFLFVSTQAENILGYPLERWLEEPEFFWSRLHPEDRDAVARTHDEAISSHQDHVIDYRMFAANGREVWFHEIVSPEFTQGGRSRLRGMMQETTEQRRLLYDLQERVKEITALAGAAYLLQRTDWSFDRILSELVVLIPPAFRCPESTAARITIGDVQKATPNFQELPRMLVAECRCATGTQCKVEVACLQEPPPTCSGLFLAEEQLLVQSIADLMRLADDRHKAMRTLEEREAYFRMLIENSCDCLTVITGSGEVLYQSPAIERMTGNSPQQLLGHSISELIHKDDIPTWDSFLRDILSHGNGDHRVQFRHIDRSGHWHVFESSGRRILDERGRPGAVIDTRDVTDRSETERKLRESEHRFRLLFEKNAAGMTIRDGNFRILQVNPALCRLLGYTEAELVRKTILDITHPDDVEVTVRLSREMDAGRGTSDVEKRFMRKDGSILWAHTTAIRFTSELGTVRYLATIQDITPRKIAGDALRRSEERYRLLLLSSAQTVLIADSHGSFLPNNGSWQDLTGQKEEESRGQGWANTLHPEDRQRMQQEFATAFESGQICNSEARIRTTGGEYRYFSVRAAPVKVNGGPISEWVITFGDITDRKRADADILTWKNRYDAAVQATRQLLYEWDMTGDAVTYGGNAEAIVGCSLSELRSGGVARWLDRIHPDDRDRFRECVEEIRHTRGVFSLQYRLRQKDGRYRVVQDSGQCYRDARGETYRLTGFVSDITDRVTADERLRASEERFRRIFEQCAVGMFVMDLEQRFLQVNPAYCRFLGYSEEELRTMREWDLVYPDDREKYEKNLAEVIAGTRPLIDMEKRCIRKDGQIVHGRMTGVFPSLHGSAKYCVAVIQDITARTEAEAEVRRRDRFFRSLIENSSDNITVLDEEGITLFQSPAIYRQLGYRPEELVGKNNVELVHPEDRAKACRRLVETLRRGETPSPLPLRFQSKDGSWRILETVGKRFLDDSGHTLGIFNTRDVTERVIAGELLQRAKQQAEAANLAKDRFLAALSHELRTPLTPVVALLPSLIQAPEIPESVRADLAMIQQNVELETRLIDDLLDLTRVAQGKVHLHREKVDVHELIHQTVAIVEPDAAAKQVSLELELSARDHHIWADRIRIQQVLWNLLKNAIKFSSQNSRIIIATANSLPRKIRISVRDFGLGIDPEQLPRIFDAFVQALSPGAHRFGGLGLGLFISRAMVEQHSGTIRVESPGVGKGTTFHVLLEAVPEEAMPETQKPTPEATTGGPLRILVVEDHANTRDVLLRLLQRQGHTVFGAEGVRDALAVAKDNAVDIVVSDLGLPDGSGLDLMPQLRSLYGMKGIAVSGYGMEADLRRSKEAGFDAHLVKPVNFKELQATMEKLTVPKPRGSSGEQ